MRVLVTGHRGYVGSVLVPVLRHVGHDVVGLDREFFADCEFGRVRDTHPSIRLDLRDVESSDLHGFDSVVHLAALPRQAGASGTTGSIDTVNEEMTVRVAECCRKAGVERFLFASMCAVYGDTNGAVPTEESSTHPPTPTAASKLRSENALRRLAGPAFSPLFLRHGEVYGISPRFRTDVLINEMVASAVLHGRAVVRGDGRAWRPVIHVEDLARCYAALLSAPVERVRNQAFNLVGPDRNQRVIDIADLVTEWVPQCTRSVLRVAGVPLSYRADASKLTRLLPRLRLRWTLPIGIRQMRYGLQAAGLTPGDLRSDRYRRDARLAALCERGQLDLTFRACRQPSA